MWHVGSINEDVGYIIAVGNILYVYIGMFCRWKHQWRCWLYYWSYYWNLLFSLWSGLLWHNNKTSAEPLIWTDVLWHHRVPLKIYIMAQQGASKNLCYGTKGCLYNAILWHVLVPSYALINFSYAWNMICLLYRTHY